MAKPQTLEELRQWVLEHKNDGKIKGELLIAEGRNELRGGLVPPALYDLAFLKSVPFGYNKSDIAIAGADRWLANALTEAVEEKFLTISNSSDATTEFGCYLPTGLYKMVQTRKTQLGWSNSQLMTAILCHFVFDPSIEKIYQRWLTDTCQRLDCTQEEIEKAVWDRRQYQAQVKRLELSEKKGELVSEPKVST
ncbi:MAG: hypothetical protein F6K31_02570 [Symploca sp. SIO2G7]|nr:hypothetical protein [Symploca sp. SIO2G7]